MFNNREVKTIKQGANNTTLANFLLFKSSKITLFSPSYAPLLQAYYDFSEPAKWTLPPANSTLSIEMSKTRDVKYVSKNNFRFFQREQTKFENDRYKTTLSSFYNHNFWISVLLFSLSVGSWFTILHSSEYW